MAHLFTRRAFSAALLTAPFLPLAGRTLAQENAAAFEPVIERAEALDPLKVIIVARHGETIAERGYRGHTATELTNIKSASKSIMSALVGIAIHKGVLESPDQKIAPLLPGDLPDDPDPRIHEITIGNLLSMQAGLGRLSGPNYGRWVSSRNWVRFALEQPFDDEPGGDMLYSTASTHLLSAILTKQTQKSTLVLAREWLGRQEGFRIGSWDRDPQGIYLGGNQMAMSARSLLAFGEIYRNGGKAKDGTQIVSAEWIVESWTRRTNSRFTGDGYGYGWFLREMAGHAVRYGWGYGGQMLYIVPGLDLVIVMTSDENNASARTGHRDSLHALASDIIKAAEGARS
ncbi:serine hydrolase domain-containing protein [Limoniibacter endophyticus]|uniref:6-aminohexanoate-dimer hydrolase n=1 Tax=Limoniibacter endophyticus TaxID=1565040 RepID=A0A8J3DMG8_9HYPH|nr:serine hydrolase [Limoniibacter endophyticus]GHC63768.1 6-aminohexanoate-dimer hydrolase [Limoniibacter endophyticus]